MRNTLKRLAAAAAVAFVTLSALAGASVGGRAPAWEGKDFVNTSALTPKGLEGKVVLLEFFGVT